MSKTVQELQQDIQDITNNIKEIQSKCQHPDYEVHLYSYRVGQYTPTRICKDCRYPIPGITQEEWDSCQIFKTTSGVISKADDENV